MNRDLKNIDKLFHENLSGAGDQPPAHIWEGIDNALDIAGEKTIARKKENRRRYAFAAILLVTAGTAVFLLNKNEIKTNAVVAGATNTAANVAPNHPPVNEITTVETNKHREQLLKTKAPEMISSPVVALKGIEKWKGDVKTTTHFSPTRILGVPATSKAGESTEIAENSEIMQPVIQNLSLPAVPATLSRPAEQTIAIGHSGPHTGVVPEMLPLLASTKNSASTVQVKKKSRFSITAFFGPDITTRNLEQNFGTGRDERKEELLRTERNSQLDFTLGARIEYKLDKHFSLQSGLSFSTNTIDIAQKTIFARLDKDGALRYRFNFSSGYTYFNPKTLSAPQFLGDSAQALSSSSTLHYVNIPLALKYNIPSGRFNFSVQAGMTARFITRQSIDAVYASNGSNEKSRANEIQGLKTSYFNGVVGVGADYSLNNKVALTLFPSFNFATSSINRDAPVKAYPNTLSLAVGVKFQM
jgi:hypothetical protein